MTKEVSSQLKVSLDETLKWAKSCEWPDCSCERREGKTFCRYGSILHMAGRFISHRTPPEKSND